MANALTNKPVDSNANRTTDYDGSKQLLTTRYQIIRLADHSKDNGIDIL